MKERKYMVEQIQNYPLDCDGSPRIGKTSLLDERLEAMLRKSKDFMMLAQLTLLLKKKVKSLIKQLNESAWMGYLKAFKDARSGVGKLWHAGYRSHCITSFIWIRKHKG